HRLARRLRGAQRPRAALRRALPAPGAEGGDGAGQAAQEIGGPAARGDGARARRDDAGRGLVEPDLQLHDQRQRPAAGRAPARADRRSRHPRRAARRRVHDRVAVASLAGSLRGPTGKAPGFGTLLTVMAAISAFTTLCVALLPGRIPTGAPAPLTAAAAAPQR